MKICIIGGGAAGMLAAIAASKNKENIVTILEKNEKLGKKLYISGKGRCNLTNNCDKEEFFKNVIRNGRFLYSSFAIFSNDDLQKLVTSAGCPLKVERGNRVFPVSDKSSDVIKALTKVLKDSGVDIRYNENVKSIKKCEDDKFSIETSDNTYTSDRVIIATGGKSYPLTGSTGDGYKFAKNFSIKVTNQYPSLVPFDVKEITDVVDMEGLSLKNVSIKIYDKNDPKKVLYNDFGEMLFTHFGVSGPIILSASSFIDAEKTNFNSSKIKLSIDLKPALTHEKLDDRLIREFSDNNNKKIKSIMESLLPKSMLNVFIRRLDDKLGAINKSVGDVKASEIDKISRKEIVNMLKDFEFTIAGTRGFDEAIVTRGGVDVKEINPKTMESKKISGLYFAGEVLDVDALTGGFNIQIAATTGFAAGFYSNS